MRADIDVRGFRAALLARGWVEFEPDMFRRGDQLVRVVLNGGTLSAVYSAPGYSQAGSLSAMLQSIVARDEAASRLAP